MREIYLLTDYKNRFGSKHFDNPYRSGMDKNLLTKYFLEFDFHIRFIQFAEVGNSNIDFKNKLILYTSSEDVGYHYKSYIEDVILYLSIQGAIVIPNFNYLRANNNKVFMELLRKCLVTSDEEKLDMSVFGTLEEFLAHSNSLKFPVVIKTAEGASGSGVFLAKDKKNAVKGIKQNFRTKYLLEDLKDFLREKKHKGYIKESLFRKKFIVQQFVPGLTNDWKVLIYGDKYFVLNRGVRKNDFRASGGKVNYKTDIDASIPEGMLNYAESVFDRFKVPHLSLDIAFDGKKFHLLEFQAIYFGNSTINMSNHYFKKTNNVWKHFIIEKDLEQIYTESIIQHIKFI